MLYATHSGSNCQAMPGNEPWPRPRQVFTNAMQQHIVALLHAAKELAISPMQASAVADGAA